MDVVEVVPLLDCVSPAPESAGELLSEDEVEELLVDFLSVVRPDVLLLALSVWLLLVPELIVPEVELALVLPEVELFPELPVVPEFEFVDPLVLPVVELFPEFPLVPEFEFIEPLV